MLLSAFHSETQPFSVGNKKKGMEKMFSLHFLFTCFNNNNIQLFFNRHHNYLKIGLYQMAEKSRNGKY